MNPHAQQILEAASQIFEAKGSVPPLLFIGRLHEDGEEDSIAVPIAKLLESERGKNRLAMMMSAVARAQGQSGWVVTWIAMATEVWVHAGTQEESDDLRAKYGIHMEEWPEAARDEAVSVTFQPRAGGTTIYMRRIDKATRTLRDVEVTTGVEGRFTGWFPAPN